MLRGRQLWQQLGLESALHHLRRLVEHAAARRLAAAGDNDASDRPIELAQCSRKRAGGGLVHDRADHRHQGRRLRLAHMGFGAGQGAQAGKLARVRGNRDHRPAGRQRGLDHTTADAVGGVDHHNGGLHRPTLGTFIPAGGIVPGGGSGRGATVPRDKARRMAVARATERGRTGDMAGQFREQGANLFLPRALD